MLGLNFYSYALMLVNPVDHVLSIVVYHIYKKSHFSLAKFVTGHGVFEKFV